MRPDNDVLDHYRPLIDQVDLVAIHEARYSWPFTEAALRAVDPHLTRDQINELVPTVNALSFELHGFHGGFSVLEG